MHLQGGFLDEETARVMSTVRGANGSAPGKLHHLTPLPGDNSLYGMPNNAWDAPSPDGMAQYVEAALVAGELFFGDDAGAGGAPAGGPAPTGPTTGIPQPGSTATAISPTFQTQISPQISPVFQQTQASPGAVQAATATQYMPGGMFAEGGSAAAAPGLSPYGGSSFPDFGGSAPTKYGGLPVSPLDPVMFTDIRDFNDAGSMIRDIRESEPFNWTPVYWIGGALVVGALALQFMKPQRRAA
jgi:hypothetical protein